MIEYRLANSKDMSQLAKYIKNVFLILLQLFYLTPCERKISWDICGMGALHCWRKTTIRL